MSNPEVSIIMNCLNGERYLPGALSSVQSQTFQNFEIIFWDNASTDESAEIARAYGEKLRYFKSEETLPLGQARNLAIAQAKGDYIAFLDCDDLWRPSKLEKQLQLFEKDPQIGLVCTDTEVSQGQDSLYRLFARSEPERGYKFRELVQRQWISMSSAMLRKSALDSVAIADADRAALLWFDEELNVCEEADLFYRIAHDWKLDHVDEPLTVWRVHGSNTTFTKFGQFASETGKILAKHRELYADYDQEYGDIARLLEQRSAFQGAIALWQNGEGAKARALISPHIEASRKYKLFWWASFLPGSMFGPLARFYFSLPAFLRS